MAFTAEQLNTKRDSILSQIASARSLTAGDLSMTNRSVEELERALARIDLELATVQGTTSTYNRVIRLRYGSE